MPSLRNESEIADFESAGVKLPGELRDFLLTNKHGDSEFPWEYLSNGWVGCDWEDPTKTFQWSDADAAHAIHERINGCPDFTLEGDEDRECDGCLTLLNYGCGWLDAIVINGDQSGMVWGGGNCSWFPHHDDGGKQLGFHAWYNRVYDPYRRRLNSEYATKQT